MKVPPKNSVEILREVAIKTGYPYKRIQRATNLYFSGIGIRKLMNGEKLVIKGTGKMLPYWYQFRKWIEAKIIAEKIYRRYLDKRMRRNKY